ncbi:MAG: ATP-binding protein [Desulfobacterales bacterium]
MLSAPKILIVDDEPRVTDSLKILLSGRGYEIRTVNKAREALECLPGYDLVLMDVKMPDMSGYEIIDYANSHGLNSMFIIMTGDASIESAIEAGAFDYIRKPFEPDALLKRVANALKQKQAKDALQKAHDELEFRVYERTAELSKANEHLKETMRECRQTEDLLKESEEKYRSMMEAMNDPVYICSKDFCLSYMNKALIERVGRNAVGEKCYKALYGYDKKCSWCAQERVQKGEYVKTENVYPKDGRVYNTSHSPIFHSDGSVSKMTIYRDITETKYLQDQLIRSERLASAGQLAASVAHEINSPLQGIVSLLTSIESDYKHDENLLKNVKLIQGGFKTIRNTVKNLLDLNRPGKEKRQPTNVNKVIQDTVSLLRGHLKKNRVKMNLNLSPEIPNIIASPQQLGQCLLNLINNSIEAMNGVSMRDGWKKRRSIGDEIGINTCLSGGKIVIEVVDTGPGISEEDMEHIFDPFYTRKKKLGMGVGLSICHGIVDDHNGSITAKNSPEGSAIFTITLPVG